MAVVVLRQLVFGAVQRDPPLGDAVRIAADRGPEIARNRLIVGDLVESEHDIAHHAVAAGNHHRHDASAEVGDAHLHAVVILQDEEVGFLSVRLALEIAPVQSGERRPVLRTARACGSQGRTQQNKRFFHCFSDIRLSFCNQSFFSALSPGLRPKMARIRSVSNFGVRS